MKNKKFIILAFILLISPTLNINATKKRKLISNNSITKSIDKIKTKKTKEKDIYRNNKIPYKNKATNLKPKETKRIIIRMSEDDRNSINQHCSRNYNKPKKMINKQSVNYSSTETSSELSGLKDEIKKLKKSLKKLQNKYNFKDLENKLKSELIKPNCCVNHKIHNLDKLNDYEKINYIKIVLEGLKYQIKSNNISNKNTYNKLKKSNEDAYTKVKELKKELEKYGNAINGEYLNKLANNINIPNIQNFINNNRIIDRERYNQNNIIINNYNYSNKFNNNYGNEFNNKKIINKINNKNMNTFVNKKPILNQPGLKPKSPRYRYIEIKIENGIPMVYKR